MGGPRVTPRFDATRTAAYACSCRSRGTRSAIIAWLDALPIWNTSPPRHMSPSPVGSLPPAARKPSTSTTWHAQETRISGRRPTWSERWPPRVAGEDAHHRADQEDDTDRGLARVQVPDRPD